MLPKLTGLAADLGDGRDVRSAVEVWIDGP